MPGAELVSERVGQFFWEGPGGRDRLEFTEHGSGDAWVVLLPPPLGSRRALQPLARSLAAAGLHVLTLDLLGHGRSDRPADPQVCTPAAYAGQVAALLDHAGADRAVVGGTSLTAAVALEVAVRTPGRVQGLVLDSPVLDRGLAGSLAVLAPVLLAARVAPLGVHALRALTRPVPRRPLPVGARLALDRLDQHPAALAAVLTGLLGGGVVPSAAERAAVRAPALVVAHRGDPRHPVADAARLAEDLPEARLLELGGPWRSWGERLTGEAVEFAVATTRAPRRSRRTRSRT